MEVGVGVVVVRVGEVGGGGGGEVASTCVWNTWLISADRTRWTRMKSWLSVEMRIGRRRTTVAVVTVLWSSSMMMIIRCVLVRSHFAWFGSQ
jgi:hypothetical protein